MTQTAPTPYHHGHLREALIGAAVELARAGGPDAVVLRAVSRAVGVSHNAAYRHFGDLDELLGEVATQAQAELARGMELALADLPADGTELTAWIRLNRTGRAYVAFALAQPGLFRCAFAGSPDVTDATHGARGVGASGFTAYELLGHCLDDLVAVGALPRERRPLAEITACCAVHGFSSLALDGYLRGVPPEAREHMLATMLDAVARGL